MANKSIPSLQHFVTFCGGSVEDIYKRIVEHEQDIITISYSTLRNEWLYHLIQWGVPYQQIVKACEKLKGERNRKANLDALEALHPYLGTTSGFNCVPFDKTYFGIGRGMRIPVNPPLLLVNNQSQKVLWVSFWSTRKLVDFTASLFASILERSVFMLPDLRNFELELVDLSRPNSKTPRGMRILGRQDFDLMDDRTLQHETDKFVEALSRRISEREAAKQKPETRPDGDVSGLPLFLDRGY